jgi:hypothetical protein
MSEGLSMLLGMGRAVQISLEMPDDLAEFRLPEAVQRRLQHLLDLQDQGQRLSAEEQKEAEGLVNVAELLSLLRVRSERVNAK